MEALIDSQVNLDLSGTGITSLPDNLTVGGSLYLSGTGITSLPDNLTVGEWLDLSGTGITSLPDNLTVGGSLYLRNTGITCTRHNTLQHGTYKPGAYLYADGILTHISRCKSIGEYNYYIGKIDGNNVVQKGDVYAHCADFSSGVRDIEFKERESRGCEQYKGLTIDSKIKSDDAIIMYRIITGACQAGTQRFLNNLREIKDEYTINEIISITKGQYGARQFADFFKGENQ